MITEYGAVGGMKIGTGIEVLGQNLLQCHFVHHKSHINWSGNKAGMPRWEAGDCLSSDTPYCPIISDLFILRNNTRLYASIYTAIHVSTHVTSERQSVILTFHTAKACYSVVMPSLCFPSRCYESKQKMAAVEVILESLLHCPTLPKQVLWIGSPPTVYCQVTKVKMWLPFQNFENT
jgi:hypothetical protein